MRRLLALFSLIHFANGLGCMVQVCAGNEKNDLRRCPDADGTCGHYGAQRSSGELLQAVDVRCYENSVVYAPFEGNLFFWRPFGAASDKQCANEGVRIEGTGQWQGYAVHIASVKLHFYGGHVTAGQEIGKAIDRGCFEEESQSEVEDHVEITLYREGKVVDPTYHLQQCQCTGQICESNSKNRLLGEPFKSDKRYNGVRGWDIECSMIDEDHTQRAPLIYSPITGDVLGRTRLYSDQDRGYTGCDNDGLFIKGIDAWIGFEARIYNVETRPDLGFGRKRIIQNEPIATRLNCSNSPDSVFLEIRYLGRVIDLTDLITAKKCQLPVLPSF